MRRSKVKTALSALLAASVLALALTTTAFAQGKGMSDSKGGPYKGTVPDQEVRTVSEPGTLALVGAGLVGLAFFARRHKK